MLRTMSLLVFAGVLFQTTVFLDVAGAIPSVYDEAGLLTEQERTALADEVTALQEKTGWDIFAVTTANANGKTATAYADDLYDTQTAEDSDGFLMLIDMDNREICISTAGEAIRYLDDGRIDAILDDAYYYVSEGDYAGCLSAMVSGAAYYYEKGIHEDQYTYDVETGAVSHYHKLTWMEVLPVLLLSAGVGAGIYLFVLKSYSVKGGRDSYAYTRYGKVDLTDAEDRFVNQTVIHQRIQTDSGGSGGHSSSGGHRSSVHRSSSGRSHGGGSRRF